MGNIVAYMLSSGVILLFLSIVYKWCLASENQPAFNRVILLTIYMVSFILPGVMNIEFPSFDTIASIDGTTDDLPVMLAISGADAAGHVSNISNVSYLALIFVGLYFAGMVTMFLFTVYTWVRLSILVRNGECVDFHGVAVVLTPENGYAPLSWLKYIVMSREDYEADQKIIVLHEMKHLALHHPVDMILTQIVVILQWFNPAAYMLRSELRNVHEYQADNAVLESGVNARHYQLLLIKKAVGRKFPALANSLNHSKLKKRITMMTNEKSSRMRQFRAAALVPAIAMALMVIDTPFVANAFAVVKDIDFTGKVTENSVVLQNEVNEVEEAGSLIATDNNEGDLHQTDNQVRTFDNREESGIPANERKDVRFDDVAEAVEIDGPADAGKVAVSVDGNIEKAQDSVKPGDISDVTKEEENKKDKLPEFPGGDMELLNFVKNNLKYPDSELEDGAPAIRVIVQMIIKTDGSVSDIKVVRSAGKAFDDEAVRVISMLPKFSPGEKDGKPVECPYMLPVIFRKK